jgi:hypothetical protein
MIERISVVAIAICIGACASSGPETSAPAATAQASSGNAVAPDAPAADGEIYDLDAPNVEATANVATQDDEDAIVCRREIITGTRMSQRVCRRRTDIEAAAEDGQDALRGMRKTGSQLERGVSN